MRTDEMKIGCEGEEFVEGEGLAVEGSRRNPLGVGVPSPASVSSRGSGGEVAFGAAKMDGWATGDSILAG